MTIEKLKKQASDTLDKMFEDIKPLQKLFDAFGYEIIIRKKDEQIQTESKPFKKSGSRIKGLSKIVIKVINDKKGKFFTAREILDDLKTKYPELNIEYPSVNNSVYRLQKSKKITIYKAGSGQKGTVYEKI